MKRWYIQLVIFLIAGLVLASVTLDILRGLKGVAHSELMGWLSLSGVGVGISFGVMVLLLFIFTIDTLWLLLFAVWLIKKIFHIESKNNTLYLP